ncbi:DUF7684 family protein [Mucilaginibacter sp. McL0603]|uniref:DUF7684 family protein n=1 Tax=Mucilaginibacter sp. McL0603 TaxID=3415670 RepID=UPI003CEFA759
MVEIGIVNNRKVFYQKYDKNISWGDDFSNGNWLVFAIVSNRKKTELFEISKELIDNNLCYACCTGEQGELLHDIIDDNIVAREIERGYPSSVDIITTWHADVENGLWFSIYAANNEQMQIDTIICLDANGSDLEGDISNLLGMFKQGYLPADE